MSTRGIWFALTAFVVAAAAAAAWTLLANRPDRSAEVADFRGQMRISAMNSCQSTAKAHLAELKRTVSDEAVRAYCDCAVTKVNAALSDDQVSRIIDTVNRTKTPAGGVMEEFARAGQACQGTLASAP